MNTDSPVVICNCGLFGLFLITLVLCFGAGRGFCECDCFVWLRIVALAWGGV